MKRYIILIAIVLAVLIVGFNAFGQDEETAAQRMQRQRREEQAQMRERFRNMLPEDREKFRAEMEEMRTQFHNMSAEDRAKFLEQMRERYGSRPGGIEREEQLRSIKAIEAKVAELKAAIEAGTPENRGRLRELPEEQRAKLREKMTEAMRKRQAAIRAIEQELAKLKGPGRSETIYEARLAELRAIHRLAIEEKATQTADRLDKLIMGIQRGSAGRERSPRSPREDQPRTRRERPARRDNN